MKIVVCVKQVPDTAATVVAEGNVINWGDAPIVLNPWDEYAVEAALQTKEKVGGNVIVITVGEEGGNEALKHSLAMGCDESILVSDPALIHADTLLIANVLAHAIKKIGDADLVVFGRQAVDWDTGLTAPQTARYLGWSILSLGAVITDVDPEGKTITIERVIEEGRQNVTGRLPAVISIVKDFGEPRYPSFMGIRKAARATIPRWSLSDVGLDAQTPVVICSELYNPPKIDVTCELITGASSQEVAETLADKILSEKVV